MPARGVALQRVLGVLVDRLLARPERRGRTLRAVTLSAQLAGGRRLARAVVFREALNDPERDRAGAVAAACGCCPRPPARCALSVERFGPPAGRAGRAARPEPCGPRRAPARGRRAGARRGRAATPRCARSASIPTRACPSGAWCSRPITRMSARRSERALPGRPPPSPHTARSTRRARRACAGARGRPAEVDGEGGRVAARVVAGGGPLVDGASRCAAATGSWWASADATWSSSTTCAPGAGSCRGLDSPRCRPRPLCGAALPLGLLVPGRRLAARGARARGRGELGHSALALTDHNSVSGSMELAQVAEDYGVRAIHGAEIDVITDAARTAAGSGRHGRADGEGARGRRATSRCSSLDERGWRNLSGSSPTPTRTPATVPGAASWPSPPWTLRG